MHDRKLVSCDELKADDRVAPIMVFQDQIAISGSEVHDVVTLCVANSESEDVAVALGLGPKDYTTNPIDVRVTSERPQRGITRLNTESVLTLHARELERINDQLVQEIAERQQSEAIARYIAQHASLRGLANRF